MYPVQFADKNTNRYYSYITRLFLFANYIKLLTSYCYFYLTVVYTVQRLQIIVYLQKFAANTHRTVCIATLRVFLSISYNYIILN
jgi:hypothetical protein